MKIGYPEVYAARSARYFYLILPPLLLFSLLPARRRFSASRHALSQIFFLLFLSCGSASQIKKKQRATSSPPLPLRSDFLTTCGEHQAGDGRGGVSMLLIGRYLSSPLPCSRKPMKKMGGVIDTGPPLPLAREPGLQEIMMNSTTSGSRSLRTLLPFLPPPSFLPRKRHQAQDDRHAHAHRKPCGQSRFSSFFFFHHVAGIRRQRSDADNRGRSRLTCAAASRASLPFFFFSEGPRSEAARVIATSRFKRSHGASRPPPPPPFLPCV